MNESMHDLVPLAPSAAVASTDVRLLVPALIADAGGQELPDRARLVEDAEGGVARVPDGPGQVRDLLEDRLGLELRGERQPRFVQRLEAAPLLGLAGM